MQLVFITGKVQTIFKVHFLARLRQILRRPEGDDVVVGLIRGRDLHQLDAAFAPVALRLDPAARAQIVTVVEIPVLTKLAAALQQTEAFRVLYGKGRDSQMARIVQRTPDPLAIAGMDRQTVGIMQRRTIVHYRRRLIRPVKEHTGQRRDAQLAHFIAQIDFCLHVNIGVFARTQHKAVGAGGARRIKQRIDHQLLVLRFRTLNPELAEARELFARRQRGIDRQTARGETINPPPPITRK